jgi:hypothetical protein
VPQPSTSPLRSLTVLVTHDQYDHLQQQSEEHARSISFLIRELLLRNLHVDDGERHDHARRQARSMANEPDSQRAQRSDRGSRDDADVRRGK